MLQTHALHSSMSKSMCVSGSLSLTHRHAHSLFISLSADLGRINLLAKPLPSTLPLFLLSMPLYLYVSMSLFFSFLSLALPLFSLSLSQSHKHTFSLLTLGRQTDLGRIGLTRSTSWQRLCNSALPLPLSSQCLYTFMSPRRCLSLLSVCLSVSLTLSHSLTQTHTHRTHRTATHSLYSLSAGKQTLDASASRRSTSRQSLCTSAAACGTLAAVERIRHRQDSQGLELSHFQCRSL